MCRRRCIILSKKVLLNCTIFLDYKFLILNIMQLKYTMCQIHIETACEKHILILTQNLDLALMTLGPF